MAAHLQPLCAKCGAEIPAGSPAGWCTHCVLGGFLAGPESPDESGPLILQDIPRPGTEAAIIGDYELLNLIAHGGMGVVYKARQRSLNRIVALKMLLGGTHASDGFKRRFKTEAETVARLQHPNIVPIYEVGLHEGQPYFSMEYVEGSDLGKKVHTQPLSPKTAAQYVMTVASAVQYAHACGIIHRDLKPSNILVGPDDRPRITDFGLAREEGKDSDLTLSGQALGTPGYLPPEQVDGKSGDIGPTSDVYSLGALLYHLLTGRPPFLAGTVADTLRQVLDAEPLSPQQLNPAVPKDLATICLKCLEKAPGRRYATAQALAEDVERWMDGRPILARATTKSERVALWARRHPALAGLALSLTLLLAAVIAMPSIFALKLAGERSKTEWERDRAESNALAQGQQRLRAEEANRLTQRANVRYQMQRAEDYFLLGDSASGLSQLARIVRDHPENRAAAERLVSALSSRSFALPVIPPARHRAEIHVARFSPDGETFATASLDHTAGLWDAKTGNPIGKPLWHAKAVYDVRFSPDGHHVVTVSGDRALQVWNATNGLLVWRQTNLNSSITMARFSPDGLTLATCSESGPARLWRVEDGTEIREWFGPVQDVRSLEFHPSRRRIALGLGHSEVLIVDLETGGVVTNQHPGFAGYVEFNADGSRVLGFNADGGLHVWKTQSGQLLFPPILLPPGIEDAHFSPDGTKVVTASRDQSARIWDAETGAPLTRTMMHDSIVHRAVFSPDGLSIATGSRDHTARVWDSATGEPLTEPIRHGALLWSVQFSPDGTQLLTTSRDSTARVWDIGSGIQQPLDLPHNSEAHFASFNRAGDRVATAARDGGIRLWNAKNGLTVRRVAQHDGVASSVCFSPDGRLLASCGEDCWVRLGDTAGERPSTNWLFLRKVGIQVRFSHDGKKLAAISAQGPTWTFNPTTQVRTILPEDAGIQEVPVLIGDVLTGRILARYSHRDTINSVAFSPDGESVATAAWDSTVEVRNTTTGARLMQLRQGLNIIHVTFSPSGDQILASDGEGGGRTARFWDVRTGRRSSKVLKHEDGLNWAEFSPDGRRIVTASADKRARIWDANTGQMLAELSGHKSKVKCARFSPDGLRIITASSDSTTRVWDVETGLPISEALPYTGTACGAEYSSDGRQFLVFGSAEAGDKWSTIVRIWESPLLEAPIQPWLAHLAESIVQQRINEQGAFESVVSSNLFLLKPQIFASAESDSLTRWAKWFLSDRERRAISSHATLTIPEFVGQRVEEGTLESLRAAMRLSPNNIVTLRKLAEAVANLPTEANPRKDAQSDFLRRRADALERSQQIGR